MRIPKHWAKGSGKAQTPSGETIVVECWGWSTDSIVAAQNLANDRSQRAAEARARGEELKSSYAYSDRPFREEVIEEHSTVGSDDYAVVTRNSYGCAVLNTSKIMFIDVDLPPVNVGFMDFIKGLFRKSEKKDLRQEQIESELDRLQEWLRSNSDWGLRAYETYGGLRYLVTHSSISPQDSMSDSAMKALSVDPLYAKLCHSQDCYRARLTPKHWRLSLRKPPASFPFESRDESSQFQTWLNEYDQARAGFSTCKYIDSFGNSKIPDSIKRVVDIHDNYTQCDSSEQLA